MIGENLTPGAGRAIAGGEQSGTFAGIGAFGALDVNRLGMEVANELGVDPTNLAASNLSANQIDRLEQQTHSGTQRGS